MWLLLHIRTHMQGPLSSSLVNDAPNLARSRNESKVSSHHHHHHHSSAGPWLSPSHIICSRENIIFFCQPHPPSVFSLPNLLCYSFFSYLPVSLSAPAVNYLSCLSFSPKFSLRLSLALLTQYEFSLPTLFSSTGRLFFKKQAGVIQTTWL